MWPVCGVMSLLVTGVFEDWPVCGVTSLPVSGVFEDVTCVWSHVTASVWSVWECDLCVESRHCQWLECLRMWPACGVTPLPVSGVFEDVTCVWSHVTSSDWSVWGCDLCVESRHCQGLECLRMWLCVESCHCQCLECFRMWAMGDVTSLDRKQWHLPFTVTWPQGLSCVLEGLSLSLYLSIYLSLTIHLSISIILSIYLSHVTHFLSFFLS